MNCPYCNAEMENGYLTSDARFLAWRKEKYESAVVKKNEDGIQLSKRLVAACTVSNAFCCKGCNKIIIDYSDIEL